MLLFSIVFTYLTSGQIANSPTMKIRYRWLLTSVTGQILILGLFKYLGFFNGVMSGIYALLQRDQWVDLPSLVLPLGISFFTFQSMGYVFDVYYKIRKPETHLGKYALFVSFFPQIQSGPIGRAKEMMPQWTLVPTVHFEKWRWAMHLFVWGLLKKFVVADRLGNYVDDAYGSMDSLGTWVWLFILALYTVQLYADFSAYSDMAIASAAMLGIHIPDNFDFPYKANNVTDFWRRWHLSLSGWLRDYIYTPLLFSKKKWKRWAVVYAIAVTFVICGIWHGANMTFVWFGIVQALILIFELFTKDQRSHWAKKWGSLYHLGSVFLTFWVISFCFILFRADDMQQVQGIMSDLFQLQPALLMQYLSEKNASRVFGIILLVVMFLIFDQRLDTLNKQVDMRLRKSAFLMALMLVGLMVFGVFGKNDFIYFQF